MTAVSREAEPNGRRNTPFLRMRELWGWLQSRSSKAEPAALSHGQRRLARATFQECLDHISGEASARLALKRLPSYMRV